MNTLIGFLFALFNPYYWLQNESTSMFLTRRLNELLDSGEKFTEVGEYTAKFGKYELWIENHPYASFRIHGMKYLGMPSRYTRYRLRKRLIESVID